MAVWKLGTVISYKAHGHNPTTGLLRVETQREEN